jgi:hypothetical protein
MDSLDIPGPRDLAVKEYSEWQQSHVTDDGLKDAFRQACDVMLDDDLDLEQVYKDRDPEFFIGKGIKNGIARRFLEDIPSWVQNVKKPIHVYEGVWSGKGRYSWRFRVCLELYRVYMEYGFCVSNECFILQITIMCPFP